jgi:NADPH:quinone reductase-like Zn-dependent oxidoreductase
MITTKAWVLQEPRNNGHPECLSVRLREESYSFPDISEQEVLVEPVYGCWEGNMTHAVRCDPIDICRQRGEDKVVIGNAGVVRVLQAGSETTQFKEGDLCLVFCNGVPDKRGYAEKIYGYDAPRTTGLLALRTKLHQSQLIRLPDKSRLSLGQWAAFSLRYITAWANWQAAYGCWRSLSNGENSNPQVWGWGGGVTYAQLTLAALHGCSAAMISSNEDRLRLIKSSNLMPVHRIEFPHLHFDPYKYDSDAEFKRNYIESEERFLEIVADKTDGRGVAIFIEYIGLPVYRATLKALARPGVITTAGWKNGMQLTTLRAIECMKWHTHVHTHYARHHEAMAAIAFAEETGWGPPAIEKIYTWDDIPELAELHAQGFISSYYPVFEVNRI